MKLKIENWEPTEWCNFLNSENHPDREYNSLKVVKVGNSYMVAIHTGYGLFTATPFVPSLNATQEEINNQLEANVKEVKDKYNTRKDVNTTLPSFMRF